MCLNKICDKEYSVNCIVYKHVRGVVVRGMCRGAGHAAATASSCLMQFCTCIFSLDICILFFILALRVQILLCLPLFLRWPTLYTIKPPVIFHTYSLHFVYTVYTLETLSPPRRRAAVAVDVPWQSPFIVLAVHLYFIKIKIIKQEQSTSSSV